ncbi:alcohol dehydrogenase catalytic domain-containing protein [Ancrocorticia populi]|uniref:alcohol dehydrogenase catalytic domain-containing protein n=1 Tax=Ancrocorticia populi TaxID=2175228 RepID=UPI003F907C01
MRAAVFHGIGDISIDTVPDPVIERSTDAIISVEAAGVCGSDLWTYRGQSAVVPGARIGHEFVGRVVEAGTDVRDFAVDDWVIVPFRYSCGECTYCVRGLTCSCINGGFWSREVKAAGQGEYVRVPFADATLIKPYSGGERPDDSLIPSLVALTDVMVTGLHGARSAQVCPGDTVTVIGDGAVAISAVMAAQWMGAGRVIVLGSTHPVRRDLVANLGVEAVLNVRGDEAVEQVRDLTDGLGSDATVECVGSEQSFLTALSVAAAGTTVGYVGLPHGVAIDPATMFAKNLGIAGGVCPARALIPGLLSEVLAGNLNPGAVFTSRYPLDAVPTAYSDLDQRKCVKPLIDVARKG